MVKIIIIGEHEVIFAENDNLGLQYVRLMMALEAELRKQCPSYLVDQIVKGEMIINQAEIEKFQKFFASDAVKKILSESQAEVKKEFQTSELNDVFNTNTRYPYVMDFARVNSLAKNIFAAHELLEEIETETGLPRM